MEYLHILESGHHLKFQKRNWVQEIAEDKRRMKLLQIHNIYIIHMYVCIHEFQILSQPIADHVLSLWSTVGWICRCGSANTEVWLWDSSIRWFWSWNRIPTDTKGWLYKSFLKIVMYLNGILINVTSASNNRNLLHSVCSFCLLSLK